MVLSGGGVQAGAALDAKIPRRLAGLEGFWVFFAALHAHGVLALHVRLGLFQAHFVGLCRQAAPAAAQYAREHGVGGVGEKALHDGDLKISPALLACCAFASFVHGCKKARTGRAGYVGFCYLIRKLIWCPQSPEVRRPSFLCPLR